MKAKKKWTWTSPDGVAKNLIDIVMVERKWKSSVKGCRCFRGTDVDPDHQLVLCKFQMSSHELKERNRHSKLSMTQIRFVLCRKK